jgi:hypothetical protein
MFSSAVERVAPSRMLSSVSVAVTEATLSVAPDKRFNSSVVAVTPSRIFISKVLAVTPSRIFISEVLAVTPSRIFISEVLAVTPSRVFNSLVEVVKPERTSRFVVGTIEVITFPDGEDTSTLLAVRLSKVIVVAAPVMLGCLLFNCVWMLEVTPSTKLSSVVERVAPSRIFNSAAAEVTVTLLIAQVPKLASTAVRF